MVAGAMSQVTKEAERKETQKGTRLSSSSKKTPLVTSFP